MSRIVWYFRAIFFYRSIQPVALSFNGQTRNALLYGWKGAKMLSPISRSVFLQEESRRRISWKRHDPFNISAKTPATYDARESFDPCEKSWRKSAFDRQRIIPCNSRPTFTIPPLLIHGKEVSSSTNFSKAASFEIFIVRAYRILLSIKQVE